MGAYLSEPITEKCSTDETGLRVSYGSSSMQGWRMTQEDAHNTILNYDKDTSFFAVYDGHGGAEVAKYCALRLPDFIKSLKSYSDGQLTDALRDGFLQFDATLITPDGLSELKMLAGASSDDSAEASPDEGEAELLHAEAEMPIEDLLARYSAKAKHLAKEAEESDGTKPKAEKERHAKPNTEKEGHAKPNVQKEGNAKPNMEKEGQAKSDVEEEGHGRPNEDKLVNGDCSGASPSDKMPPAEKGDRLLLHAEVASSSGADAEKGAVTSSDGDCGEGSSAVAVTGTPDETRRLRRPWKPYMALVADASSDSSESEESSEEEEDGEDEEDEEDDEEEEEVDAERSTARGRERRVADFGRNNRETKRNRRETNACISMGGCLARSPEVGMPAQQVGFDSGCTAVVALLRGRTLVVANAGDSRCVVCRSGKALDMSLDHKPEDATELSRIRQAGGTVTRDGRVNGGLNLSRAIGDHAYKRNAEFELQDQMITALPDVKTLELDPETDEFMVLACDGIWWV
ncbi:unnamed protein product, partial [Ixodes hexagonus]